MQKTNGSRESDLEWWCASCWTQERYKALANYVKNTRLWELFKYSTNQMTAAFNRKPVLSGKNGRWRRTLEKLFRIEKEINEDTGRWKKAEVAPREALRQLLEKGCRKVDHEKQLEDLEWDLRYVLHPSLSRETLEDRKTFKRWFSEKRPRPPLVEVLLAAQVLEKNVCLISTAGFWFFLGAKEVKDVNFIVMENHQSYEYDASTARVISARGGHQGYAESLDATGVARLSFRKPESTNWQPWEVAVARAQSGEVPETSNFFSVSTRVPSVVKYPIVLSDAFVEHFSRTLGFHM